MPLVRDTGRCDKDSGALHKRSLSSTHWRARMNDSMNDNMHCMHFDEPGIRRYILNRELGRAKALPRHTMVTKVVNERT